MREGIPLNLFLQEKLDQKKTFRSAQLEKSNELKKRNAGEGI